MNADPADARRRRRLLLRGCRQPTPIRLAPPVTGAPPAPR